MVKMETESGGEEMEEEEEERATEGKTEDMRGKCGERKEVN